jgi:hypothetical protein
MKNKILITGVLSLMSIPVSGCMQNTTDLPPGKYESKTSSTDSNGTTTEQKKVTDVTVDEYGNKTTVIQSKTSKDPRGLFNKSTSSSKQVIHEE